MVWGKEEERRMEEGALRAGIYAPRIGGDGRVARLAQSVEGSLRAFDVLVVDDTECRSGLHGRFRNYYIVGHVLAGDFEGMVWKFRQGRFEEKMEIPVGCTMCCPSVGRVCSHNENGHVVAECEAPREYFRRDCPLHATHGHLRQRRREVPLILACTREAP